MMSKEKLLPPVHPGEVLLEDFMKPLGLSSYRVAKDISVNPITISLIIRGKRAVSSEMALRLSRYTGTTAAFWNGLQAQYDLEIATRSKAKKIEKQIHLCSLLPRLAT